jgi:hypothetical protein
MFLHTLAISPQYGYNANPSVTHHERLEFQGF